MEEKAYYKQILKELETELAREMEVLANFKRGSRKCKAEGWKADPFQAAVEMSETNVANIEKAIAIVKEQSK
jgi:hypothetical protein